MLEHLDAATAVPLRAGMIDLDLSLVVMLALFLVFAFLLSRLVVKPLIAAQEQRYGSMEGARERASAAELRSAETRLAYEKELTAARQAAVEIREELRASALNETRVTLAKVRAETDAQIAAGQAKLAAAAAETRAAIHIHADALADDLAKKLASVGAKA